VRHKILKIVLLSPFVDTVNSKTVENVSDGGGVLKNELATNRARSEHNGQGLSKPVSYFETGNLELKMFATKLF
jgi:hypothetical protein